MTQVRGVRGAVTLTADSEKAILTATGLLGAVLLA